MLKRTSMLFIIITISVIDYIHLLSFLYRLMILPVVYSLSARESGSAHARNYVQLNNIGNTYSYHQDKLRGCITCISRAYLSWVVNLFLTSKNSCWLGVLNLFFLPLILQQFSMNIEKKTYSSNIIFTT